MALTKPTIGIVVPAGDPMPPGLSALSGEANIELLSGPDAFNDALPRLDAMAVYDFRTRVLRDISHESAPRLRWIHASSAGVDAVLVPGVVNSEIVVTNARGIFDPGIAEYVLGLMLLFAKDFHTTLDLQRRQQWKHRESLLLRGKRLLVVGAGSIGTKIGTLAKAAGVEVAAIARDARDDDVFGRVHPAGDLDGELASADFVAIATPLTRETRGMFDAAAFTAMKPGAFLINIGRGPIVDEPALIDALNSGHLGGAGLDVFAEEPLPAGHPFWTMPNVLVSPHMAGDIVGWEEQLGELFVENVRRWRQGDELINTINKAAAAALMPTDNERNPEQ